MGHIMAKFRQQNKSFDVKLPKRSDGSGRQPRPLHPTPEAENAFVDFQGLMHFRFMVSTHAKFFVVFPFYEPTAVPPGFGVRQSSGAFGSGPRAQKRQRTAAVQDASAPAAASSRFMVPMHAQKRMEAFHEPTHPQPLPGGEQAFVRGAKVPLLGGVRGGFMVPVPAPKRKEAL